MEFSCYLTVGLANGQHKAVIVSFCYCLDFTVTPAGRDGWILFAPGANPFSGYSMNIE
jgi:hypothetical protein